MESCRVRGPRPRCRTSHRETEGPVRPPRPRGSSRGRRPRARARAEAFPDRAPWRSPSPHDGSTRNQARYRPRFPECGPLLGEQFHSARRRGDSAPRRPSRDRIAKETSETLRSPSLSITSAGMRCAGTNDHCVRFVLQQATGRRGQLGSPRRTLRPRATCLPAARPHRRHACRSRRNRSPPRELV